MKNLSMTLKAIHSLARRDSCWNDLLLIICLNAGNIKLKIKKRVIDVRDSVPVQQIKKGGLSGDLFLKVYPNVY